MMWRKWLSWLPEERENSGSAMASHAETEACREWTPFLTALFDGEADEDGALRARRHLLVCERCARAWMDWNQTRSLLINHSAPPPPPSLLWRIRLACRLGKPAATTQTDEAPVPQLAAQILAQTSRRNAKPATGFAHWFAPMRGLRFNAPFVGALAMGAFVLFMARDSLLVAPPPPPLVADIDAQATHEERVASQPGRRVASTRRPNRAVAIAKTHLTAPHSDERNNEVREEEPRVVVVSALRRFTRNQPASAVLLERTRRERESLASSPIRLASFESEKPLSMLQAPPPLEVKVEEPKPVRKPARPPRLARLPRIAPGPVASAPRMASPAVLASFEEAPFADSTPTSSARSRRSGRAVLASASLPSAPLRISTPHALPIVVSHPSASDADDSGLDELDSAVQDYRASFADADESDFASDAG